MNPAAFSQSARVSAAAGFAASVTSLRPAWRRRKPGALWLLVLLLVCSAAPAVLAAPRVGLRIEPLSIRGRSGGPIGLQIKLEYNQPQLLEGDLLLQVYHGTPASNRRPNESDLICALRYEGIVLQGTDYFFRIVLPPIEHATQGQYEIEAWFQTQTERIPLSSDVRQLDPPEPHDVLSVRQFERATLLCSCSGQLDYQRLSPERRFLNEALSLNNYNPLVTSRTSEEGLAPSEFSRQVQLFPAPWDARDLPEDPLALCCFDIVLLADGSVSKLQPRQMQALKTWVEAGGSLCVLPSKERMDRQHLGFLQELFESEQDADFGLSLNDQGEVLVIGSETDSVVLRNVGLGRAALLPVVDDLQQQLTPQDLGRLVAHLWKARRDSGVASARNWGLVTPNLQTVLDTYQLMIQRDQDGYYAVPRVRTRGNMTFFSSQPRFQDVNQLAAYYGSSRELFPTSSLLLDAASESLLPQDVEMVPAWVIGIILAAYVITVGPVDYLVLGWLRVRKLTWLLFPVVTIVYTLLTVAVANQYMATTETGGQLTVTDVVDDGRPVRESTLRLHFYGARQTLQQEATAEFRVTALPAVQFDAADVGTIAGGNSRPQSHVLNYNGRFPQAYTLAHTVQQWSPRMTRTLSLSPDSQNLLPIDWADPTLVTTAAGRSRLTQQLTQLSTDETVCVGAVVLHAGQTHPVPGVTSLFDKHYLRVGQQRLERLRQNILYSTDSLNRSLLAAGIVAATQSPGENYFGLVSQVSPQGSAALEDLAILDPSDPRQWALVVLMQTGNQYHAIRKLYFVDPD